MVITPVLIDTPHMIRFTVRCMTSTAEEVMPKDAFDIELSMSLLYDRCSSN